MGSGAFSPTSEAGSVRRTVGGLARRIGQGVHVVRVKEFHHARLSLDQHPVVSYVLLERAADEIRCEHHRYGHTSEMVGGLRVHRSKQAFAPGHGLLLIDTVELTPVDSLQTTEDRRCPVRQRRLWRPTQGSGPAFGRPEPPPTSVYTCSSTTVG
jgi:hypothetical protein